VQSIDWGPAVPGACGAAKRRKCLRYNDDRWHGAWSEQCAVQGARSAPPQPRSYDRACAAVDSVLHHAVRNELETFLSELHGEGRAPLPRYVLQALRGYLRCGDFSHGFSRHHCRRCKHDLLVAFSCGKRSICPSGGVRRMDEIGAASQRKGHADHGKGPDEQGPRKC